MLADACALRALLPQVVPGRQVGQAGAAGGGRLQGQVDRPGPHSEPVHYSSGLLCRQRAAWLLGRFAGRLLSCARARAKSRGSARRGRTRATPGAGTAGPATTRRRPLAVAHPADAKSELQSPRAAWRPASTPPAAMRRLLAAGAAA